MRSRLKDKQKIWFTTKTKKQVGIDTVYVYSAPTEKRMTVSATSGTPEELAAGIVPEYDRYITSYEKDFSPSEGDCVFVDVTPSLDSDGNLVMQDDDDTEPVTPPDYYIKKIIATQKGRVFRYGISKIGDSA